MMLFDPVMMLVAVVAMFCYYALKGNGGKEKKDMSHKEFIKWFAEQEAKRSKDYVRYQNWLYDHRQ